MTGEYSHVQGYDLTVDPKILTGVNRLEELALYVDALAHHSSLFATTFAEMCLSTSKGCVNLIYVVILQITYSGNQTWLENPL